MTPYEIIYADPPWRYSRGTTTPSRAIEQQYQTMSLNEIKSFLIDREIRPARNSILFLWATSPLLPEALEVIGAWGYSYRSSAVWDKERIGLGYWFRIQHELLLVGVRGKVSPPKTANRVSSVWRVPRGKHSRKPDAIRHYIEQTWPNANKVELFAREACAGWDAIGNEVEQTLFS